MNPSFVANKLVACLKLQSCGIPVSAVADVGVQAQTSELIRAFPYAHHHLFEPVTLWHESIKTHYLQTAYTLHSVALSDANGFAYVVESSINKDGKSSHATISREPVEPDGLAIVKCTPVEIRRLDAYSEMLPDNYLLKIDVDGVELDIIRGSSGCIRRASIVIVEAPYWELSQRGAAIEGFGFELVDIVDRVMYGQALWQCDLVYVREDLVTRELRPSTDNWSWQAWRPLP